MNIAGFLEAHKLPETYQTTAQNWFIPLAKEIESHQKEATSPFFVGVNGCQGSGKSTLCDFLIYYFTNHCNLKAETISLDDFYLDQVQRNELAEKVHPLLKTRGVPGTHDVTLADETFQKLKRSETVSLPRFNKATDNPFPQSQWPIIEEKIDIVLIEGWCWGTPYEPDDALIDPVNELEQTEDPQGIWRQFVNQQLKESYQALFSQMQYWVMLKAPSFANVLQWRTEQEHKLAAKSKGTGVMTDEQVLRFIQHYERLTTHSFNTLPSLCNQVIHLDENRNIIKVDKAVL